MTLAARTLDALGPAFRARAGAQLPDLVDALTSELEGADQLVQPTGPHGSAAAFDASATPQPRWLAAATGTQIPGGLTLEQQCTYLNTQPAWRRGTVPAMQAAVRTVLTGSIRPVEILERIDGDPYRWGVRVHDVNLPGGDTPENRARVVAAALTEKPLGLLEDDIEVDVVAGFGTTYHHFAVVHGTYTEMTSDFETYDDIALHVPEEGTPA